MKWQSGKAKDRRLRRETTGAGMLTELRILDAAGNRAREALRVMEDVARFALDDTALTATLKAMRHDLADVLATLVRHAGDDALLLAARDTPGDTGTAIQGAGESKRANLAQVAMAAGSRLTEALRTLEEIAKTWPRASKEQDEPWERLETLRYAAYDAHKRLVLALAPAARQWRVCVLITESLCTHHSWTDVARLALAGGADCLQLREKSLDSAGLLARARTLVQLAQPHAASVIVNDRPDIALLAGADGVHLGQSDLSVADVRRLSARPARRLLVGVSCSTIGHARRAADDGADYLGLGPMFDSTTKPKPSLSGPDLMRQAISDPASARVPHLAISGITTANIPHLVAAGCRGVAVSSAVCSSPDPASAVRTLRIALDGSPGQRE